MNEQLRIGKVAKQAGVNVQTLRYYERRGLLNPSGRLESGYRLYPPGAAQRVRFIKNAQAIGFTLREISGLLRLRVSHKAHCGDVKRKAQTHLKDVKEKIIKLQAIERVLGDLIKTCNDRATTDHCPILKTLDVWKKGKGFSPGRKS